MRYSGRTSLARLLFALALCAAAACRETTVEFPRTGHPRVAGTGGRNIPEQQAKPYVVLVSLDGFRADYFDRFDLPNIRRLAASGARARAMIPVFPSLTFPNHYSLVTGLYPERHGIVSNTFYDPQRKQTYALSKREAVGDGTWYRGEPIWVTAETQGMVSACFFWPGSEAAIHGVRPSMWKAYDETIPNAERVRTVLDWLRRPAGRRPHVIMLYFSDLDTASHNGPLESPAVAKAAISLDRAVGALIAGLDALPIRSHVYVILTSDHGMVNTSSAQSVRLSSLVDTSVFAEAFGGPVANLHLRPGVDAAPIRDRINARLKHGRAYLRAELPQRYHHRADPRAGDIVIVMDESWTLAATLPRSIAHHALGRRGMHGWDPALPSMHALFVAAGPGIRAGTIVDRVENVDVYPFMTELLGLRAPKGIDGRGGAILGALSQERTDGTHATRKYSLRATETR